MDRRLFLAVLTSVIATRSALAQPAKVRVGMLGPPEEPRYGDLARGLREGLREQGHTDQTLELLELRAHRRDRNAAKAAIAQLRRQGASVVFVVGSELARLVREFWADTPVVFVTPGDPVASGLLASFSRPGANMTAVTFEFPELSGKRLELLKTLNPTARRALVVYDPRDASSRQGLDAARSAAPGLGLTVVDREITASGGIGGALGDLADVHGVLLIPGGATLRLAPDVIQIARQRRVPTIVHTRTAATAAAVISYGASDVIAARQAARLVDKVLRGARAGELPVERPARIELVINRAVATAMGLTVPPALLLRADFVID